MKAIAAAVLVGMFILCPSPARAEAEVWGSMPALILCYDAGIDPAQVLPTMAGPGVAESGVMSIELEVLTKAYWTKHPNATQATVQQLLEGFDQGWTPAYFRAGRMALEDEAVVATGVIDEALLPQIVDKVASLGIDTLDSGTSKGWVVLFKDLLPEYYRTREVLVRLDDGETLGWPHLQLTGDLNIPAFTWTLTLVNGAGDPVIAQWPVVVGKTSTRTPRTVDTVYCTHLHHYPPWTDPETHKYVPPGKWNPLGLWKLMPTEPKKVIWYYHGTNQPKLLNRDYRAFSHGCIRNRNENIAHLALFMLTRNAGTQLAGGQLTGDLSVFFEKRTRMVELFSSVPAKNRYHCLDVKKDPATGEPVLYVYPDVYWFRTDDGDTHRTVNLDYLVENLKAMGLDPATYKPADLAVLTNQLRIVKKTSHFTISQIQWMLEPAMAGKETAVAESGKAGAPAP